MLRVLSGLVVVTAFACAAPSAEIHHGASHEWWHGSITVSNESNYDINHLFLTPAHESHWGPDQLGSDVLGSHHQITLAGLECENYDLKIIDHEGDECVVTDVDLCLEDAHWQLTDHELAACTGYHK